jgi:hypothetical protein
MLTARAAAAAPGCPHVAGAEAILHAGAHVILGEIHGTRETPALIADLACRAAELGAVRVGLEIFAAEQARLDAFIASAGTPVDQQALLKGAFWTRDFQDGRSSVGMLRLLERLRVLKKGGADVAVVPFDVDESNLGGEARDRKMADNLQAAFARAPKATFVILAGNLHARKAPHPQIRQTFMTQHLVTMKQAVTSLDARYGLGSTWACMPECGPHVIGSSKPSPPGIALAATGDGAFDGTYAIPSPTFAAPAVRALSPDESLRAATVGLETEARRAYDAQDWSACVARYSELAKKRPADAKDSRYGVACCHARGGDANAAFASLSAAVDAGFADRAAVEGDDDFKSLHEDARWPKLLARLPRKTATPK